MKLRPRVYIAGPISKGPLQENIRIACEAGIALIRAGLAPLVPHLTCYMGGPAPEVLPCGTVHTDWYESDLPWVSVSDAVLRLPGESVGAEKEVELALLMHIPVFTDLNQCIAFFRGV